MFKASKNLTQFDMDMGGAEKLSPPAGFKGPPEKYQRRITDLLCLITFLGTWGLATYIGIWSLQDGNFDTLAHNPDYRGRLCGIDLDSYGNPLPSKLHTVDLLSNGICVYECPSKNVLNPVSSSELMCKEIIDLEQMPQCLRNGTLSEDPEILLTCGGCFYQMETIEIKGRCEPKTFEPVMSQLNKVAENLGFEPLPLNWMSKNTNSYLKRLLTDLYESRFIIALAGFGGSILLSIFALSVLRHQLTLKIAVWISALFFPITLASIGVVMHFMLRSYRTHPTKLHSDTKIIILQIFTYLIWIFSGLIMCTVIYMRNRINLAISITKVAVRAISDVKHSILFPFIQFGCYAIFLFVWGLWLLLAISTGKKMNHQETVFGSTIEYTMYKYDSTSYLAFWFLIFVFFWTSHFILGMGHLTLSLCFSRWYYTMEKDTGNDVSILDCMKTVVSKHAGTAAVGSIVLLPITFIRKFVVFFQNMIRKVGDENKCLDIIICSCQCCLFSQERFMKYVSANAYIQTALFGHSFCKGSHESFYLILRNAEEFGIFGQLNDISMTFCNLFLVSLVTLGTFIPLYFTHGQDLFSITVVVLIVAVISLYVVAIFTGPLRDGVATILHCFLADEEMFGYDGSFYIPEELDNFLRELDGDNDNDSSVWSGNKHEAACPDGQDTVYSKDSGDDDNNSIHSSDVAAASQTNI